MNLDVPDGWTDRTVFAYSAPIGPEPVEHVPSIVMTREPLAEDENLRTHADRVILGMAHALEELVIIESREAMLGGLPAIHLRFRWKSPLGALEQGMTMCEAPSRPGERGRFVALVTTTALVKVAAEATPLFGRILGSFRFGPEANAPAPMPRLAPLPPPRLAPAREAPPPRFHEAPLFGMARR